MSLAQLANSAWPMFRHDLKHTGRSPYTGPATATQKWAFTTGGIVQSSPTIGEDGTIYVGANDRKLYAIKPDGTLKWAFTTGDIVYSSPAIGADGTIYVGSSDNKLYAIKPDGTQKWAFTTGYWVCSSPSIGADGTIYVGSRDNKIYAIKSDGTLKWELTYKGWVNLTPGIGADGTIYVGSRDNKFYAIKSDGTQKWAFTTGGEVYSSPGIGADGTIYVGSRDNKLYAIKPDGTQKWAFTTGSVVESSPSIGSDGTIFVGSYDHNLYAIGAGGNTQTLTITPTSATLNKGATQQFTATPSTGVTWSATGGTISNTGLFTAGNTVGTYTVTAKNTTDTATASVTITAAQTPAITITAPNGGEQWQQGSVHPITWTSTGVPGNVKIDLFKGGVLNGTIIASTTNTGSFNWTVPANQAVGTDYQVKIIDLADVTVQSKSAANFAVTAGAPKSNDPWPMFHHDLQHTGRSPFTGPANPSQKWAFTAEGVIYSSPAISADGTVYFGAHGGNFYAIKPDGTQKWVYKTNGDVNSSPTIGVDGTIYVGSRDHKLYAFNSDGSVKWTFLTKNWVESSPIIGVDGTIYISSEDKNLYAINPDGTQKWIFTAGNWLDSTPALGTDGTIYIGSDDKNLYAINPDGTQKWIFTAGGYIRSSPIISVDGTIYFGSLDKKIYAVDINGKQKWVYLTGGSIDSTPAIASDGTIYVGSRDNNFYAFNTNGTLKWLFKTSQSIYSSPAIGADNTIYFGSDDSKLYAINPNGVQKWVFTTKGFIHSSPAIGSDGTIYIGSYDDSDKNLYAIGNGTAPTLTITPPTATLNTGATQQFTANPATGVTWTATGGTISKTGLYTAGNTAGTYTVTAKNTTDTATASVTITAAQTLTITPPTATLNSGATQQFTASPSTGVAWLATGGTISNTGLYTAGNTAGTFVVTAKSAAGTATASVTITAKPTLATPVQVAPQNNAANIIAPATIVWQPVANAVSYEYEVYGPASATVPVETQTVTATSAVIQYTLTAGTSYNWRVRAIDANGVQSAFSPKWTFTTIVNQGLAFPILTSPANGSTGAAIATTLNWLPVDNAVNYTVQYATNNNFNKATVLTGAATTQNVTLLGGTRYYWHVKAIDANGQESGWSSAWYFTTAAQTTQMDAPTLITPADSVIDVPIKTTFTWTTVANAVAYDIEVSKDATFATRAVMGSNSTSLTTTLANSIVYYWRVRGKNGNSLGTWSAVGTFTTEAFVPTTGVDAAIANSKVGSPLMGIGVVNNDGTLQTVTVEQPINRQSEFNIMVKNTGNQPDNFLVSTTSTINAKWKVTVFDVSGIDITRKVFNGGWSSYIVKPGESVIMRLRFAATSGQIIDPTNPPTQSIMLTAQSWKDITNGVATPATDTVVGAAVLVKMSK